LTISLLQDSKIPFVFMANDGGITENECVAELGKKLRVDNLDETQYIQTTTPFKTLVPTYADQNILVIGGSREVAKAYGFKNVLTSTDIHNAFHGATFTDITCPYYGLDCHSENYFLNPDGRLQISAIFIWSDPDPEIRAADVQLVTDLLLSAKGIIGTVSPWNGQDSFPNRGYGQDGQPSIYFCEAQSEFQTELEESWALQTKNVRFPQVGNPCREMFEYANSALQVQQKKFHGLDAKEVKNVYMVSSTSNPSNPATNLVRAANYPTWTSILIRRNGQHTKPSSPRNKPTVSIYGGVQDAVEWAMEREEWWSPLEALLGGPKFIVGPDDSDTEGIPPQGLGFEFIVDASSEASSAISDTSPYEEELVKVEAEMKREFVFELIGPIPHMSGDWPPLLTGVQEMD
jgi:hypothetical protein